jgi:hypothetical protein
MIDTTCASRDQKDCKSPAGTGWTHIVRSVGVLEGKGHGLGDALARRRDAPQHRLEPLASEPT